ncbi:NAD(P)/FAD-dependent oxidoreductase [Amycolatopsis sp. WAC 01416]|uniref:phytoene desaturase family protein n=1 Tax=Amycolatopsis sp. WAC 01416 TaxID=2203196 RepID=UPI000F7A56F6|nr:NAD(P)/FAD-dependent oxidoreductase [Amycolatopsis sp. WAC 01416]RSN31776.1 NAD(P)/FAD-dependent oxidoreductase [Amycolatopsis sp. WAC 01416]
MDVAENGWDALVIGSGMSGLTAAGYLAVSGKRVLVLESYDVIGGNTHVFRRAGKWEFDVGVHYLGDCLPGGKLPMLLNGLGQAGRVEFLPMDSDGFDTITFPDLTVRVPRGWDGYRRNLIDAFPDEARKITRIVRVFERIGRQVDLSATPSSLTEIARFAARCGRYAPWAMVPLARLFDVHRLSPKLRAVLSVHCGAYGSPPSRTPVVLHAAFLQYFLSSGGWYPRGGGQVLSARLAQAIVAHGGEIRTRAEVDRILIENGRTAGVRLAGGQTLRAPVVVSTADIKRTYLDLVGEEHLRARTLRRIRAYRMSMPFFNVYLGVDIDLADRMPNTNYFACPTGEDVGALIRDLGENAGGYDRQERARQAHRRLPAFITVTTTKDPHSTRYAPRGGSVIEAMSMVPADPEFWGLDSADDGAYGDRETYREMKQLATDAMVARVAETFPGIEDHIRWVEAATPMTQTRYTRVSDGTPYGIECSVGQFGPFRPRPRTEIPGLFIAGVSTAWGPGVTGAALSGLHAAGTVLGRDIAAEVFSGSVLGDPARIPADPPGEFDTLATVKSLATRTRRTSTGKAPVR